MSDRCRIFKTYFPNGYKSTVNICNERFQLWQFWNKQICFDHEHVKLIIKWEQYVEEEIETTVNQPKTK